jgi:hypothetical protein
MSKNQNKQISQPDDWWAAFERMASLEGMTLSEWVGEACKARIQQQMSHQGLSVFFSDRTKPGRKAKRGKP